MKKLLTITVLMALAVSGFAQELHYDFAETVESGQTLYFLKGYYGPQDVMVTYPCYHDTIIYNAAGASTHITTYYYGHDEPSGDLVIPSTIIHNDTVYTITTIGYNTFWKCTNITSLTLPNTLNSIIQGAFAGCTGITGEVVIPNSVTNLGRDAFTNCTSLNSVVFSTALTNIGFNAFKRCTSLDHISPLPESLTRIYDCAFEGCSQLSGTIVIPPLITQIDEKVFNSCNITSVVIPEGVTKIKSLAFGGCPLDSIFIPSSVTSIKVDDGYGAGAFCGCTRLQSIIVDEANSVYDSRDNCNALIETATNTLLKGCKNTIIPNTVSIIWEGAFAGCLDLDSITIPNSVSYLGIGAFERCNSLSTITLPSSVSYISDCALACSGLTSITCKSSTPPTAYYEYWPYDYYNSFMGVNREIPIYIPLGTTEAYQNASGWNYFHNFIEEEPIIFTEFEPDTCFTLNYQDTIYWDLNQDGTYDIYFYLVYHSAGGYMTYMSPVTHWEWSNSIKIGQNFWQPLTDTSMIDESLYWQSGELFFSGLDSPEWWYFAFRHQTEDGIHYGWAHIKCTGYCNFCISGMGYCTIPNYPIVWGQTNITEGVEEETIENDFSIYPNPATGTLFVQTVHAPSLLEENQYRITNTMGQTVLTGNITTETQQINIASLSAGMYFITVAGKTQKFIVE